MGRRQVVVPVGHDEQHRRLAEPAAGEPQQVYGRLVGPVDIFHHDHAERSRYAHLAQQGTEQFLAAGPGYAQVQQVAAELVSQIVQWPERAGDEQAVARAPRPAGIGQVPLKLFHQC